MRIGVVFCLRCTLEKYQTMWKVWVFNEDGKDLWCSTSSERNARDIVRFLRTELTIFLYLGGSLKGSESHMRYSWEFVPGNDQSKKKSDEFQCCDNDSDSIYGFLTDISDIDPGLFYQHLLQTYRNRVDVLEHAAHLTYRWLSTETSLLQLWELNPSKLPTLVATNHLHNECDSEQEEEETETEGDSENCYSQESYFSEETDMDDVSGCSEEEEEDESEKYDPVEKQKHFLAVTPRNTNDPKDDEKNNPEFDSADVFAEKRLWEISMKNTTNSGTSGDNEELMITTTTGASKRAKTH
jgi:hypothetical protein